MLEFRVGCAQAVRSRAGWNRSLARTSVERELLRRCTIAALALPYLALACDESGDGSSAASPSGGTPAGAAGLPEAEAGVLEAEAGGAGALSPRLTGSLSPRLARYHRTDSDRALRFELDAVDSLGPYPASLEYLTERIGRVLPKPDGISFDHDETLPAFGEGRIWTFGELDEFSRLHAADDETGPVSIHVLLVDGRYDSGEGSETVLGLAWGQRHIALFQDAIRAGCSGVLGPLQTETCEVAERSVWAHEIGHVIGLVDNGVVQRVPHRDTDHGRHDLSEGCLMYWAYDSPEVFDLLLSRLETGQTPDIDFCEQCWADLNAVQR